MRDRRRKVGAECHTGLFAPIYGGRLGRFRVGPPGLPRAPAPGSEPDHSGSGSHRVLRPYLYEREGRFAGGREARKGQGMSDRQVLCGAEESRLGGLVRDGVSQGGTLARSRAPGRGGGCRFCVTIAALRGSPHGKDISVQDGSVFHWASIRAVPAARGTVAGACSLTDIEILSPAVGEWNKICDLRHVSLGAEAVRGSQRQSLFLSVSHCLSRSIPLPNTGVGVAGTTRQDDCSRPVLHPSPDWGSACTTGRVSNSGNGGVGSLVRDFRSAPAGGRGVAHGADRMREVAGMTGNRSGDRNGRTYSTGEAIFHSPAGRKGGFAAGGRFRKTAAGTKCSTSANSATAQGGDAGTGK